MQRRNNQELLSNKKNEKIKNESEIVCYLSDPEMVTSSNLLSQMYIFFLIIDACSVIYIDRRNPCRNCVCLIMRKCLISTRRSGISMYLIKMAIAWLLEWWMIWTMICFFRNLRRVWIKFMSKNFMNVMNKNLLPVVFFLLFCFLLH